MMNNKFDIVVKFDCGNCPLQKDEEILISEMFINLANSLNSRGIEMINLEVNKYGD